MAEIDWPRFGGAVFGKLDQAGLSYRGAVERWPCLDKSMLSRAVNGRPLSAANYMVVCTALGIDPNAFLIAARKPRVTRRAIRETLEKQAVAVRVSREAGEGKGDMILRQAQVRQAQDEARPGFGRPGSVTRQRLDGLPAPMRREAVLLLAEMGQAPWQVADATGMDPGETRALLRGQDLWSRPEEAFTVPGERG